MHPILAKIGPLTVYSYGVMVAAGFSAAMLCIYRRAPGFNVNKNDVVDLAILMLITGIAGARLFYCLLNLDYYLARPIEILRLSRGGLVWYGGFLAALISTGLYMRIKRLHFWAAADLIAPYLAFAQAFGRIGCFLNGCCYGIALAPGMRHPVQLYSSAALVAIFLVLRFWQDRRRYDGEVFLGYCMLYAAKRFIIEFLRGDSPKIFPGLSLFQYISAVIFLAAVALFIHKAKEWKKGSSGSM